jgi:hypothetical protein
MNSNHFGISELAAIVDHTLTHGGGTFPVNGTKVPDSGYIVAILGNRIVSGSLLGAALSEFCLDYKDSLEVPGHYLGTWASPATAKGDRLGYVLDVVTWFEFEHEALAAAAIGKEKAIYCLHTGGAIYT